LFYLKLNPFDWKYGSQIGGGTSNKFKPYLSYEQEKFVSVPVGFYIWIYYLLREPDSTSIL
jgi:hypothetical protein